MTAQDLRVPFPTEGLSPRPPFEPLLPGLPDAPVELLQTAVVRWSAVVLVVAPKFRIKDGLFHGVVPMRAVPFRDGLEGLSEALLELPSPAERTLVRQAEKVEGVGLCPRPDRSRQGCAPELYETRLFRMEGQSVPCEPLGKYLQDLLCVLPILKAERGVIGISEDYSQRFSRTSVTSDLALTADVDTAGQFGRRFN